LVGHRRWQAVSGAAVKGVEAVSQGIRVAVYAAMFDGYRRLHPGMTRVAAAGRCELMSREAR